MRDYSKVGPQFWVGETGKALKKGGVEAVIVGMYLMTSPHANMLGLYYLPEIFIAHETGLGIEGAMKGLQRCIEAQFCAYDKASEMVWVYEMAKFQIGEELEPGDKRVKGVQNEYSGLPTNPFLSGFFEKYSAAYRMTKKRVAAPSPLQAPSKPLRSQEQEQKQEQKQEQEQDSSSAAPTVPRGTTTADVKAVFEHWRKACKHPQAKLDAKRDKLIRARLGDGYTPEQLCAAIDGVLLSPHHQGENDRHDIYDDVALICRDAEHVDKFIRLATAGKARILGSAGRKTVTAAETWLGGTPEVTNA